MQIRLCAAGMLLLTAVATVLAVALSDPGIEHPDDRAEFIEQVNDAADQVPIIYVFQVVDVARGFLMAGAGVALYLMLRDRTRGLAIAGLVALVMAGVFAANTAFTGAAMVRGAEDYVGKGLDGIGTGDDGLLEMIRVLSTVHFGAFLASFASLGLGVGVFSYGLAWSTATLPRWLGWLGICSGGLLSMGWLALIAEVLFLPLFIGGILSLVWLFAAGIWLAVHKLEARVALEPAAA